MNLGIVISSLMGYLEWGTDQHMFLFKGELDILYGLMTNPSSVLHPFTLLPLAGQILLLSTVFKALPKKWVTYLGMALIALLFGLMFVIGVIGPNWKILGSTLPFFALCGLQIVQVRQLTKPV
ncbi:MAG: hypothetical protein H6608_02735 [Flavobacteriales bacterium]|nr:hypothetical protein [Flavobacteriales bacterium]